MWELEKVALIWTSGFASISINELKAHSAGIKS